jgi:hypothetical protein
MPLATSGVMPRLATVTRLQLSPLGQAPIDFADPDAGKAIAAVAPTTATRVPNLLATISTTLSPAVDALSGRAGALGTAAILFLAPPKVKMARPFVKPPLRRSRRLGRGCHPRERLPEASAANELPVPRPAGELTVLDQDLAP